MIDFGYVSKFVKENEQKPKYLPFILTSFVLIPITQTCKEKEKS